jgi:hypothetical protein
VKWLNKNKPQPAFSMFRRAGASTTRQRRGNFSMMVMMVVVIVMVVGFFITATGLFERLLEIPVDLLHLADRCADKPGNWCQAVIDKGFLPFLVFGGMLPVVIDPVFQQYPYLLRISHAQSPDV